MKVLLVNSGEYFKESSVAFCATHGRPPTNPELRTRRLLVRHPWRTIGSGCYTGIWSSFSPFREDDIPYHCSSLPPQLCVVGLCVVLCAMACAWHTLTKQTSGSFLVSYYGGGGTDKMFSENLISTAYSEVSTLPET